LRFADLNNRNNVAQKLTFSLGFVGIIGFFIGADVFSNKGESGTQTAGLIVVLIATLPELYFRFAELTMRFTQVRMAQQSVNRLLQYEAPALTPPGVATAPENTIRVEQARYRFSGGDIVLGGPDGMNCVFGPTGLTAIVGPAGAGKSTLIRLILGRQRLASGRILLPEDDGRPLFAYLPQRPILFDTPIRDNLFLGGATPELSRHVADHAALSRLGLIHLIRLKGLDAPPGPGLDPQTSLESVRTALRREIQDQLGLTLTPLGAGAFSPRQMTIEAQLSQAVDQGAFAARLGGEEGRRVVAALAATTGAEGLIALAVAALRASAALLARSGQAEDYNKVASFKIDPEIFGLRQMALMSLPEEGAPAPSGPEAAILVAVGLSLRLEEIAPAAPPPATGEFLHRLEELVEGVSRPLSPERVNPFLTWRENLLFAVPDAENASRQSRLDEILVEKITATPLDVELIESGLDYPVGRQGGRLSGGQQQLVGFGRALLTPSRFLALDEPSSAFHPQLRLKAIEVLRDEARSRGVIVVTHDLDLARACDRVIFIRDGAIAGQGAWEDLVAGTQGFAAWVNDSRVQP
jgi:ABC-type multidrug transport system ATPase subunit